MRLFFYVEIVLIVIVGAACALFTVTGIVGLVRGGGLGSLWELVGACIGAYVFLLLRGDIERQRRRSADPEVS